MKKKLSVLLIAVLACMFMFTGCDYKATVLDNTDGVVTASTNGSAVVEKGDYIYFVNGKAEIEDANEFGKVTKGSLVRVVKSGLANPSQATFEVVIPKLFVTGQYNKGVYFYGDNVYFATPSDKKNASGEVKTTQTEFYKFNLKTGKMDKNPIATSLDNSVDYTFTEKDGVVYLVYTFSEEGDDESVKNYLQVVNTQTKSVWTSDVYQEALLPEDNSNTIFYTVVSYSEELDEDSNEKFHDIYSYTVGDSKAELRLSGAGSYAANRGDRDQVGYPMINEGGLDGFTVSLIKNTGKYLFYSITTLATDTSSKIYFGIDYNVNGAIIENFDNDDGSKSANVKNLGYSDNTISSAITQNSFVKGLNEIYYVDSYYGLSVFDYTKSKYGTLDVISENCKNYTLYLVEDNLFYFADSSGFYYVVDIESEDKNLYKLNGLEMVLKDNFFKPTVINVDSKKYFIGVYSAEYFYNYTYVIDITNAMEEPAQDKETSDYQEKLDGYASMDREKILELNGSLLGIMTAEDKEAFDAYVEANYSEEE